MDLEMMWQAGGEESTEMDEATRKKVERYVTKRVGGMRCPDHDKPPTVICRGTRLDNLSFEVKGCCNKIIYMVKTKLEE
jgi:hypothetical protein